MGKGTIANSQRSLDLCEAHVQACCEGTYTSMYTCCSQYLWQDHLQHRKYFQYGFRIGPFKLKQFSSKEKELLRHKGLLKTTCSNNTPSSIHNFACSFILLSVPEWAVHGPDDLWHTWIFTMLSWYASANFNLKPAGDIPIGNSLCQTWRFC